MVLWHRVATQNGSLIYSVVHVCLCEYIPIHNKGYIMGVKNLYQQLPRGFVQGSSSQSVAQGRALDQGLLQYCTLLARSFTPPELKPPRLSGTNKDKHGGVAHFVVCASDLVHYGFAMGLVLCKLLTLESASRPSFRRQGRDIILHTNG